MNKPRMVGVGSVFEVQYNRRGALHVLSRFGLFAENSMMVKGNFIISRFFASIRAAYLSPNFIALF